MNKASTLVLISVGLFPVLFSSCSTTRSTPTNPAGDTIANHGHHHAAAGGDDKDSSDGPDTFGNPLVEF